MQVLKRIKNLKFPVSSDHPVDPNLKCSLLGRDGNGNQDMKMIEIRI